MALQGLKLTHNFNDVEKEFLDLINKINSTLAKPFELNINVNQIQNQLQEVSKTIENIQNKTKQSSSIGINVNETTEGIQQVSNALDNLQRKQIKIVDGDETQKIQQINDGLLETQKIVQNIKNGSVTTTITEDYGKAQKSLYQDLNTLQNEEYSLQKKMIGADEDKTAELQKQLDIVKQQSAETKNLLTGTTATGENYDLTSSEKEADLLREKETLQSNLNIKQNEYEKQLQLESQEIERQIGLYQTMKDQQIQDMTRKYGSLIDKNAIKEVQTAYQNLNATSLSDLRKQEQEIDLQLKQIALDGKDSSSALKLANQDAKGIVETLTSDVTKFMLWQTVATGVMQAINQVKSAISYLNELNTSQTNISMVTDMQMSKVQELTNSYSQLAKQLGENNEEMNKGAETFLRAGLSSSDTTEMLKENTIASKLSGVGSDDMSNYLISIKNGFHLETDAISSVIDALSTLDNKSSTSFKDISEAMQRSSATSNQVGISWQKLASYITIVSDVTHKSAETIGESYKTIFTRLTNVKAGVKDEDGMGINDVEKVLSTDRVNVKLRETSGEWRNMGDVISEIASKWKSFDSVTQSQVSTAVAGTRQAETFLTLMQNWSKEQEYEKDELKSSGSAWEKYQTYLQSTDAKLNILKTTLHDMYSSLINSSEINNAISLLTIIVEKFGNFQTVLGLVGTALALWKGNEILKFFQTLPSTIISSVTSMQLFKDISYAIQMQQAGEIAMNEAVALSFDSIGVAIKTVFLSNPLGMIAIGFTTVVTAMDLFNSSANEADEALNKMKQGFSDVKQVDSLVSQYNTLNSQIEANTKTGADNKELKDKLLDVERQLAQKLPETTNGYDAEGNAITTNTTKVKELNEAKKQQLELEARETLSKNQSSAQKAYNEATFYNNQIKSIQQQLKQGKEDISFSELDIFGNATAPYKFSSKDQMSDILSHWKDMQGIIDKDTSKVNSTNSAISTLNSLLGTNTKLIGDNSNKKSENTSETNNNTNATKNNNQATETAAQKQEDLQKSLTTSTDTIKDYSKYIKDMNSNSGKLSSANVQDILKNHAELIPYLSDEKELYNQIQKSIDSETQSAQNDYKQILENSDIYYKSVLSKNSQLVNDLKNNYGIDLSNYTTLAEAKEKIDSSLLEALTKKWGDYFSMTADGMAQLDQTAMSKNEHMSLEQATAMSNDADTYNQQNTSKLKAVADAFKSMEGSFNVSNVIGQMSDVSEGNDSTSKAESAAKDAEEKAKQAAEARVQAEKDANSAIVSLRDSLVKALKEKLDEEKQAELDKIKAVYDAQVRAIEDKKKLIQQDSDNQDYQEQLSNEEEKLQKLQSQYNQLKMDNSLSAQSQRDDLQDQIKAQQQTISDLQRKHDTTSQINNLDNQKQQIEDQYNQTQTDIENKYKQAENDAQLYAQAQQMITSNAMQEMVNLINQYAPDFSQAGANLMSGMNDEVSKGLDAMRATLSGNYSSFLSGGKWSNDTTDSGSSGSSSSSSGSQRTLSVGSSGADVKQLQQYLGVSADGIFGNQTRQAVMNWQSSHGLSADGIVGTNTHAKLGFSEGGEQNFTGEAILHGTPEKPERVLSGTQTEAFNDLVYDKIPVLSKLMDSITVPNLSNISMPNINIPSLSGLELGNSQHQTTLQIDHLLEVQGNVDKNVITDLKQFSSKITNDVVDKINKTMMYKQGKIVY